MEHPRIIDALPEHEAAIRALSDQTHAVHRARLPHKFGPKNGYQHFLLDTALGHRDTARFRCALRVAIRGDALIGYALAVWDAGPQDQEVSAVVADIAVTEQAQRQGIGKALLADLDGLRATHGWHSLTADVWQGNAASHALFAKAGFAADRTEYRLGTPPDLQEDFAPMDAPQRSANFWWIAAGLLVALAIVAGRG